MKRLIYQSGRATSAFSLASSLGYAFADPCGPRADRQTSARLYRFLKRADMSGPGVWVGFDTQGRCWVVEMEMEEDD